MKRINQNRTTAALILIAGFVFPVATIFGQPLKVNIRVNSTVGIQQTQPFEILPEKKSETGVTGNQSRTVNALGAFTIMGKENSNVLVQLNAPKVLTNKENQSMPFTMSLAWQNSSAGDVNKLQFNQNKSSEYNFGKGPNAAGGEKKQDDDRLGYLYLKGTAEVPADSQSPLIGEIHLTIEY